MKRFSEWFENKRLWMDLYYYLLQADSDNKGVFKDPNYHNNLVKKLRDLGLDEEANDLEIVRISQKDIDFANDYDANSSQQNYHQNKTSLSAAYNVYLDHIENLMKKVVQHIGNKSEI